MIQRCDDFVDPTGSRQVRGQPCRFCLPAFLLGVFMVICFAVTAGPGLAGEPVAGTIVDLNGRVEILADGAGREWARVTAGTSLGQGARVRTGSGGWAAILLSDETMLRLGPDSLLILKQVGSRAGWLAPFLTEPVSGRGSISGYLLERGRLWLRNKNRNQHIEILTPTVSTSIRGTEVDIWIQPDETVAISVLEGVIQASGSAGSLIAEAGEQVRAMPGEPLAKQVLLSPRDTVQWTVPLESLIDHIDARLPGTGQGRRIRQAVTLLRSRDLAGADKTLEVILETMPEPSPAWVLRSLIALAIGRFDQALQLSDHALRVDPGSADAWIVKSYALQAGTDLAAAMAATDRALALDPGHVPALVNRAKLFFMSGDRRQALPVIDQALAIDREYGDAHSLKGFLLLAGRKTSLATAEFSRAVELDSGLGEPHLGLALAWMRLGEYSKAVRAITTAVLLEPQRSVFLSYWAKMLVEMRRFDQALDILAQAEQLDPNDPTPLLYRSHILRDLNRPYEAIQALNKAVRLNDNRAVFRSRFLLDQDLAVKNVSLAELYRTMGMSEWGGSKAMASVKADYANSAAHTFLADEYRYLYGASSLQTRSEDLKAFLMKPANLNTFNAFNDYTAFFEKPNVRTTLSGYLGSAGYRKAEIDVNGAAPETGVAVSLNAGGVRWDGLRDLDHESIDDAEAQVKWDVTAMDSLSMSADVQSIAVGDLASRANTGTEPDPLNRSGRETVDLKLGWRRHLSPRADLLVYAGRRLQDDQYVDAHAAGSGVTELPDVLPGVPLAFTYDYFGRQFLEEPYTTFQAMQLFRIGDHQLAIGTFQFWSERDYSLSAETAYDFYLAATGDYLFSFTDPELAASNRTRRQQTYYLQDTWRLNQWLTLEAALFVDAFENVNSEDNTAWTDTSIDPRFGLIFRPTRSDTFRLSLIRSLDPIQGVARLDPTDIAGHALPSFYEGSVIDEVSASWEHEWDSGYLLGRWFYNEPDYTYTRVADGTEVEEAIANVYQGTEVGLNWLVGPNIGFSAAYTWFDIDQDQYTPELEGIHEWLWGLVTLVHPSGVSFSAGPNWFRTRYDDPGRDDEDFWIMNARLRYDLPDKRGRIELGCVNLFDERFNSVVLTDRAGWVPERLVTLMVELNF